jgi:AcrR family transcriptional regulator
MSRPSQLEALRKRVLPVVARTFSGLGYRRSTTAELARRSGIGENILYRLWPDKRAMFIASIEYVYALSSEIWAAVLAGRRTGAPPEGPSAARRLLDYESSHHGEFGLYRIVFAGLGETDDPLIRDALRGMYRRFQRLIARQVRAHRRGAGAEPLPEAALAAWAIVGLGTVANLGRELGLLPPRRRRRLISEIGGFLLGDEGRHPTKGGRDRAER